MKIWGVALNTILIALAIMYVIYLGYGPEFIPDMVNELFSNILFRVCVLILIVMLTMGDKTSGIGGPVLGIVLAIAYVITHNMVSKDMEAFADYEEDMEGFESKIEELDEDEQQES